MISLGEMIAYLPIPGGHITLAERYVNPAWSFTLGWNYCALSSLGHTTSTDENVCRVQLDDYPPR